MCGEGHTLCKGIVCKSVPYGSRLVDQIVSVELSCSYRFLYYTLNAGPYDLYEVQRYSKDHKLGWENIQCTFSRKSTAVIKTHHSATTFIKLQSYDPTCLEL